MSENKKIVEQCIDENIGSGWVQSYSNKRTEWVSQVLSRDAYVDNVEDQVQYGGGRNIGNNRRI